MKMMCSPQQLAADAIQPGWSALRLLEASLSCGWCCRRLVAQQWCSREFGLVKPCFGWACGVGVVAIAKHAAGTGRGGVGSNVFCSFNLQDPVGDIWQLLGCLMLDDACTATVALQGHQVNTFTVQLLVMMSKQLRGAYEDLSCEGCQSCCDIAE